VKSKIAYIFISLVVQIRPRSVLASPGTQM